MLTSKLESSLPSLEEELRPVSGLQAEDVLFLGVVSGFGGQSMVDSHHIVGAFHKLTLLDLVFILILKEDQVAQNSVHHLPTSLAKRGCNKITLSIIIGSTESAAPQIVGYYEIVGHYLYMHCAY